MNMRRRTGKVCRAAFVLLGLGALHAQPNPVLFEGARLILGTAAAPVENGALLVQNGRIAAIGASGSVKAPPGAARSPGFGG